MKSPRTSLLRTLPTAAHGSPPWDALARTQSCPTSRLRLAFAATWSRPWMSRPFSGTRPHRQTNRIFDPFRIPPQFHDALRLCSANNSLLLALFTTSACTPCRTITPLLTSLVETRAPSPHDQFAGLAFAEIELDSPDTSNGNMMELGVEYGVTSMPTLMGFGGRRAERVTDRVVDTRLMTDPPRLASWIDDQMKGDPFSPDGAGGEGRGRGILGRLFG